VNKVNPLTLLLRVTCSVTGRLPHQAARIRLWLSLLLLISLAWFAWPDLLRAAPPAQAPDAPPSVSGGRALWTENCVPCHGPTGQGDGPTAQAIENPIPNLADPALARQRTPLENFEVIKNGRIENLMPPWGNRFNDAQIWDLTAMVWNLSVSPEDVAAGEAIYFEQCAACHGDNGTGDTAESPAEMIDFTDLAVMSQRSQADLQAGFTSSAAHTDLADLPEAQLWQSLDYIRTFSLALPQSNGLLTGQVLNATTNQPQGNIEVKLLAFQNETLVNTLTTQTDENGRYTFEDLATDHSIFYMVEGSYQDISYSSQPVPFVPDSNETTLNLEVYETTTSAEAVELDRLNYLVSFDPGSLSIIQLFVLSNSGNATYIGQNGQTFSFELPAAATDVRFQGDAENYITQTENGYISTEPVLPGQEGLLIAAIYAVPYEGDRLSFEIPVPAELNSLNLLMQDIGAELSSPQLQFVESREVPGGGKFSIYSGSNLAEGSSVTLELTGLNDLEFAPAPGNAPAGAAIAPDSPVDQNLLRWLVVGLGVAAILLTAVFYPQFRSRLGAGAPAQEPEFQRQKLLLLLARLDDAFEKGELDEQVYRQARARYKVELSSIMRQT